MTAVLACRACGTEPLENARFCHGCGAPVADAATHAEYKQRKRSTSRGISPRPKPWRDHGRSRAKIARRHATWLIHPEDAQPPLGDAASSGPCDGVTTRHEWVLHASKFE
jgi:hypothetical protein